MASRISESLEPADERAVVPPQIATPPHIEAVLRMQATAGNQATSRLIARDQAAPAEKAGAYVLAIEGFGSYEVRSLQMTGKNGFVVTFNPGEDAARLMQAASNGQPIKSVTVTMRGHTITLTEAIIASFNHATEPGRDEPLVSVAFDGRSAEFK